ncbi:hypothetical protein HK102_004850, partial [Quaeritorhiza haematococci]
MSLGVQHHRSEGGHNHYVYDSLKDPIRRFEAALERRDFRTAFSVVREAFLLPHKQGGEYSSLSVAWDLLDALTQAMYDPGLGKEKRGRMGSVNRRIPGTASLAVEIVAFLRRERERDWHRHQHQNPQHQHYEQPEGPPKPILDRLAKILVCEDVIAALELYSEYDVLQASPAVVNLLIISVATGAGKVVVAEQSSGTGQTGNSKSEPRAMQMVGEPEIALEIYRRSFAAGVPIWQMTYGAMVYALYSRDSQGVGGDGFRSMSIRGTTASSSSSLETAIGLHDQMRCMGMKPDRVLLTHLVLMALRSRRVEDACRFLEAPEMGPEAEELYLEENSNERSWRMRSKSKISSRKTTTPTPATDTRIYCKVAYACLQTGKVDLVDKLLRVMKSREIRFDRRFCYELMVGFIGPPCYLPDRAVYWFERLAEIEQQSASSSLPRGRNRSANSCSLSSKNCTKLFSGLNALSHHTTTLQLFSRLIRSNLVVPDLAMYTTVVSALGRVGHLDGIEDVLNRMDAEGVEADWMFLSCLVDAYGRCGIGDGDSVDGIGVAAREGRERADGVFERVVEAYGIAERRARQAIRVGGSGLEKVMDEKDTDVSGRFSASDTTVSIPDGDWQPHDAETLDPVSRPTFATDIMNARLHSLVRESRDDEAERLLSLMQRMRIKPDKYTLSMLMKWEAEAKGEEGERERVRMALGWAREMIGDAVRQRKIQEEKVDTGGEGALSPSQKDVEGVVVGPIQNDGSRDVEQKKRRDTMEFTTTNPALDTVAVSIFCDAIARSRSHPDSDAIASLLDSVLKPNNSSSNETTATNTGEFRRIVPDLKLWTTIMCALKDAGDVEGVLKVWMRMKLMQDVGFGEAVSMSEVEVEEMVRNALAGKEIVDMKANTGAKDAAEREASNTSIASATSQSASTASDLPCICRPEGDTIPLTRRIDNAAVTTLLSACIKQTRSSTDPRWVLFALREVSWLVLSKGLVLDGVSWYAVCDALAVWEAEGDEKEGEMWDIGDGGAWNGKDMEAGDRNGHDTGSKKPNRFKSAYRSTTAPTTILENKNKKKKEIRSVGTLSTMVLHTSAGLCRSLMDELSRWFVG